MKSEPLVIEKILNAPAERVWKAITDKEQMKEWGFNIAEFKPERGFEFEFKAGKKDKLYVHKCRVMEVIPGKKLQYSWRYEGYEGNSFVTWELFADGQKTKLKLTHEGLETFPISNPDLAKGNFEKGWESIIGTILRDSVEKAGVTH